MTDATKRMGENGKAPNVCVCVCLDVRSESVAPRCEGQFKNVIKDIMLLNCPCPLLCSF